LVLVKNVLKKLPRDIEDWSLDNCNDLADELWQKSYAEEFQQNLREHITQHFPQLVIPQMIERFNIHAGNAVAEWAVQTTTAILNSSEERYQKECANLKQIRISLERFLDMSDRNLRERFEKIDVKIKQVLGGQAEGDPASALEATIVELRNVKPYNSLGEKLYPLYGWRRELGQGVNQVLESVAKSLTEGKVALEGTNLKKANHLQVTLLGNNLKRLVDFGYTPSVAKYGKTMEARSDEEKRNLKRLNQELNELALHLQVVMEDVLNQIVAQEVDRMYQAVEELFSCHLSYLEQGSNNIAPNMAIKFPESQLAKVKGQLSIAFKFQSGFPITQGTWFEQKERVDTQTGYGANQTKITVGNAVGRNTKGKGLFDWDWWVGAAKGIVVDYFSEGLMQNKKYIDYVELPCDKADIPSIENLLLGWVFQAKEAELKIVNQVAGWLLEQVDDLKTNVNQVQSQVVDRYQARLDKANQEMTLEYDEQMSIWEPLHQEAQKLAEEFSKLGSTLKKEP
jgi:hypothetical protein